MALFWKPIKIYGSFLRIVDRSSYFCKQCVGKKVLHVGCADYPATQVKLTNGNLLHPKLTAVARECTGIDLSQEGLEVLRKNGFTNVKYLNAENINTLGTKFDVILAGDVIEHVTNPAGLLKAASECLQEGGELVISTPNAFSFNTLRFFLTGAEPTHYEHCYYFSVKTLTELCRRFDLVPVELAFTTQLPTERKSKLFMLARNFVVNLFPKLAPGIVMKFRKLSQGPDQQSCFTWN